MSKEPAYPPEYDAADDPRHAEAEVQFTAWAMTLLRSGYASTEVHAMVDRAMQACREATAQEIFGGGARD